MEWLRQWDSSFDDDTILASTLDISLKRENTYIDVIEDNATHKLVSAIISTFNRIFLTNCRSFSHMSVPKSWRHDDVFFANFSLLIGNSNRHWK